ncbi:WxL protein peptidoglycan domain-containing protein [Enterococcus mundtii]|uniref:WxL protein peptidoglycan domain-containing protein n=1 Tax=Enterococcus mundtii TaxID=53346 RepID=UPI0035C7556F
MTPGQKQTIQVLLDNSTDKSSCCRSKCSKSAATSINGNWSEYSPTENKKIKTLKYDLAEYVKMPDEIALQPESQTGVRNP